MRSLSEIASYDVGLATAVTELSWVTDEVSFEELHAITNFSDLARNDLELAKMVAHLLWFADDMTSLESESIAHLSVIASNDVELAKTVASLPWFSDGVTSDELNAIRLLNNVTAKDLELARRTAALPWLVDGVTSDELNVIWFLGDIVANDLELARRTVALPWFIDSVTSDELSGLFAMRHIAANYPELARQITFLPWLVDGVTSYSEKMAIWRLSDIAANDLELAKRTAALPWFIDGVTSDEMLGVSGLSDIAASDLELARQTAALPWFIDGVTSDEMLGVSGLSDIVANDLELARQAVALPWFIDGVTSVESNALFSLADIAEEGSEALDQLTTQPWFRDGLDDAELALVVTLGKALERKPALYRDLLQTHFMHKGTISLPLAGDVNVWIFQDTPFQPGDDTIEAVEDTARVLENFLGIPFPTKDVVILVETVGNQITLGATGAHYGTHVWLTRNYTSESDWIGSVYHETSHYYFNVGPVWFFEGLAQLAKAYINDWNGKQSLADRGVEVSEKAQDCILGGIENIRHDDYLDRFRLFRGQCKYYMAENFFLRVFEAIGEEAISSALRELHISAMDSGLSVTEEQIYDVFLSHAPSDREDVVRDLYRRLHGGSYAFPETDLSDDHGDEARAATAIAVGEVVEGTLDYMFDFDYFRFVVKEGKYYQMTVNHESLRLNSVIFYASDGLTLASPTYTNYEVWKNWRSYKRTPSGPQIHWIAPSFGEYYLAVHNFGGLSGSYTLTITTVDDVPDDHGDGPDAATDISVGEIVEGDVDDVFDFDYFRFQASKGLKYRVIFFSRQPDKDWIFDYINLWMYLSDGVTRVDDDETHWTIGGPTIEIEWVPSRTGEYYFAVAGKDGHTGTYTLTVTNVEDEPGG